MLLLTFTLLIPIIALALVIALEKRFARQITIAATLAELLLSIFLIYEMHFSGLSFSYSYLYGSITIPFSLSLVPISAILLFMSVAVILSVAISSSNSSKAVYSLLLLLQASAAGLFESSNLFFFFIFWDVGVISAFFMIYLFGSPQREQAAIKFIIYEAAASIMLLFAIILIYYSTGTAGIKSLSLYHSNYSFAIFFLMLFAFMINMGIFPFHFWLPDAYGEASTEGSMAISAIVSKFGALGSFYLLAMFSNYSHYIAAIAIFSAFYASFMMIRERDIKRIVAYASMLDMSLILFALTPGNALSNAGAAYSMLSHGLAISLLFLAAGSIEYVSGTRNIRLMEGIAKLSKSTAYIFIAAVLLLFGLPLGSGFIADLLIFMGAVQSFGAYGLLLLLPILIAEAFFYYVIARSMFVAHEEPKPVNYLDAGTKHAYALLLSLILLFGLMPFIFLSIFK
ncbi:MAG: complex I subunit 4 family protein [Candidatus Micrarchaeia archaeon]